MAQPITPTETRPVLIKLICAIREDEEPSPAFGLFYYDTPEGRADAARFARTQNEPGWGIFDSVAMFREGTPKQYANIFATVLAARGCYPTQLMFSAPTPAGTTAPRGLIDLDAAPPDLH